MYLWDATSWHLTLIEVIAWASSCQWSNCRWSTTRHSIVQTSIHTVSLGRVQQILPLHMISLMKVFYYHCWKFSKRFLFSPTNISRVQFVEILEFLTKICFVECLTFASYFLLYLTRYQFWCLKFYNQELAMKIWWLMQRQFSCKMYLAQFIRCSSVSTFYRSFASAIKDDSFFKDKSFQFWCF
jgi:hypothetical protein